MEKKTIGLLMMSLTAFLLLILLVGSAGGLALFNLGKNNEPKYLYECQVKVVEKFIGKNTYIDDVSCKQTGKCVSLFSVLNPFTSEGSVIMYDSSYKKLDSKKYKTSTFGGSDLISLKGCSSFPEFNFKAYDDDGNLMDEYKYFG